MSAATVAPTEVRRPLMADPLPIAFGLFAFTLSVFGIRFFNVTAGTLTGPTSDALNYAILVGGIAETLGGVLAVIRGVGYPGWVTSIFGLWLIGFFLLIGTTDPAAATDSGIITSSGGHSLPTAVTTALQTANTAAWHSNSLAWYSWMLFIPVLLLAVPSFLDRHIPFMVAFTAVLGIIALFGAAFHGVYTTLTDVTRGRAAAPHLSGSVDLLHIAGYLGFVAAAALYFQFAKTVYQAHRMGQDAH